MPEDKERKNKKRSVIVRTLDGLENRESLSATFVGEKEIEKFS